MELLLKRTKTKKQQTRRISVYTLFVLLLVGCRLVWIAFVHIFRSHYNGRKIQQQQVLITDNNTKHISLTKKDSILRAAMVEHETNKQIKRGIILGVQGHPRQQQRHSTTHYTEPHVIPNILIFTHSTNLLLPNSNLTGQDAALYTNVQRTIQFHPNASVRFLTDEDCLASLQNVMGIDSPMLQYFRKEPLGMFKADICRGAALYESGGLYFDVDVQARMSMWDVIEPSTQFCVPLVHVASKYPGNYFQAFIAITPRNPIMKRYLELFLQHYEGSLVQAGPLGVILLKLAHDQVLQEQDNINTNTTTLWQEVLYRSQLFPNVPPPNWGTRRACRFVVVANKKRPFVVPLYSRTKGSRMCGGVDSTLSIAHHPGNNKLP